MTVRRPGIPAVPTDAGALQPVLTAMKQSIETLNGSRGGGVHQLSSNASLDDVIEKTNELIRRQFGQSALPPPAYRPSTGGTSGSGSSSTGSYTWTVATLAAMAAMSVAATVQWLVVERYDSASEVCFTRYKRIATEPSHALKGRTSDGQWWCIDEPLIDARMAGAIPASVTRDSPTGELVATGTDASSAITRAHEAGKVYIRHAYVTGRVLITTPNRTIEFDPGAYDDDLNTWYGGGCFPAAGMSGLTMFSIRARGTRLLYPRIIAEPCTGASSTSTLSAGIDIVRQGTTLPSQNWRRRQVQIIDPYVYGGTTGLSARSMEDFELIGGLFEWQFDQGIVGGGDIKRTRMLDWEVAYTACIAGSGGVAISPPTGSSMRDVTVRGIIRWCGWLAGTLSGMTSTGPQSGLDVYLRSAENTKIEIKSVNNGDAVEVKKESDSTSHNNYRNSAIAVEVIQNMCRSATHIKLRDDASGVPSTDIREQTEGMICSGSVTSDPISQKIVLGAGAVATTAGSKTVTITVASHWGEVGEMFKLFGCPSIGGVSATEFCKENYITAKTGTTISFELPYEAASTATGGTSAELYGLFRTPQTATIDFVNTSTTATINLTGHDLVVGDVVNLSTTATTAGVDATYINRTFRVNTVPTANSLTVVLATPATSTVSSTATKVRPRRNNGELAVWATTWNHMTIRDMTVVDVPTVALFEGLTGASEEPMSRTKIVNWSVNNCGNIFTFGDGYIDDMQVSGIVGTNYGSVFQTRSDCKAVRRLRTAGTSDIVTRVGISGSGFIDGGGFLDCQFGDDKHVIDGGPYYLGDSGNGSNEDTARCYFFPRSRIANPDDSTLLGSEYPNFELDGAETDLVIANGFLDPSSTSKATIEIAGTPGISTCGVAYNNHRSYTTNGSGTLLTWAGAEGEVVKAVTPAAGYSRQEVSAAGDPATWVAT